MTVHQPDPLDILSDRERREEREYFRYDNLESWLRAHPLTMPPDWDERQARIRSKLSAYIAALDALGDAARYAKMVLRAAGRRP